MKRLTFLLATTSAVAILSAADRVCVSDFGFDPEDSTRFIQAAIDSGATEIRFRRQPSGPWVTTPLKGRSNMRLVFEEGAELRAKKGAFLGQREFMMSVVAATNVAIVGLGKGATWRMHKADYQKPPYEPSEWRHAVRFAQCSNVLIENMTFAESGGDGIVVSLNSRDVVIRDCRCIDNHRQGITVGSGENILIERTLMRGTRGTAPEAGIDFEPDSPSQPLINCMMRDCVTEDNAGNGYHVHVGALDGTTPPVSITFENCLSKGDARGVYLGGSLWPKSEYVKGFVRFENCRFESSRFEGLLHESTFAQDVRLDIVKSVFSNCCVKGGPADFVFQSLSWACRPPDGVCLDDVSVFQSRRHPWIAQVARSLTERRVTDFRGRVRVCGPDDGCFSTVVLDQSWRDATFPPASAKPPLPRVPTKDFSNAVVRDLCPGRQVRLPTAYCTFNPRLVFSVDRPGIVTFVARQQTTPRRGLHKDKMQLFDVEGRKIAELEPIGAESQSLEIAVPKAGFYRLQPWCWFVLEATSVPVAYDLSERHRTFYSTDGRTPFSLWFSVPARRDFGLYACGIPPGLGFSLDVMDPRDKSISRNDFVCRWSACRGRGGSETALYSVRCGKSDRGVFQEFSLDMGGVNGFLFPTPEKTWSVDRR